jgi:hypothetical protein
MKKVALLTAAMLLAAPFAANAATWVQSSQVPNSPPFDLEETTWTETATFDKFDPAMGTLTGVEIKLWGEFWGEVTYENEDDFEQPINFMLEGDITADVVGGGPSLLVALPLLNFSEPVPGNSGSTIWNTDEGMVMAMNDPSLAFYTGAGDTFDVDVRAEGVFLGGGPGNTFFDADGSARAEVTVTYYFRDGNQVPVPEPATMTLLATGLAGILVMRRRAAKK